MDLPKVYEPAEYEDDIYELWEKSRAFEPEHRNNSGSFSMVFPLPNANGNLHLGHALTNALHDILTRYHRMKGEAALYLPGADHAGFETWVVYEKQLAKEGRSRFDFTRDELYRQVWDFVALNKSNLEQQFRSLGASCDWSRFTFSLDDKIVRRAYGTFKKMWDEDLIYRGERLVNFCTFHGTAFADIEVDYQEEQGHLWYIRYPLVDKSGEIVVATTRPETMLGDTAVAVNSKDDRFKHLIGKAVHLPLIEREIPIIADDFVDPDFGTGAVKITPAHDPNDFEAGQRHNLPMVPVIDHQGQMVDVPEIYRGLDVKKARDKIVKDLTEQGFLVKTEAYKYSVGHCYKCGNVIQPLLMEQWFINMKPLAKKAIEVLEAGEITFYPIAKKDQLVKYLKNLRDWNISRQIAWGIPIPAFKNIDDSDDWIYDERVDKEIIEINGKTYHRDPDVFDTWFSSSSWPYATLDFPNGADFKEFYPLNLMETGGDILMPWVSRMIMFGLYVTGEIPFKDVYLHGLIFDEHGQKMSKSKGNVIDPMQVIERYGSDALRMGIIAGRAPAVNRGYDPRKVEDARNFCNKLWNIARYIEDKVGDKKKVEIATPESIADHWILSKLQHITGMVSADLDNYRFAEAYENLYHFVWDDFADWYIEASKVESNLGVLALSLEIILKLAHPFAPFVSETIWQTLKWEPDSLLITSRWPEGLPAADKKQAKVFEDIKALVSEIRNLSHALGEVKPNFYYGEEPLLTENADLLRRMANLGDVGPKPAKFEGLKLTSTALDCWLDIEPSKIKAYLKQLEAKEKAQEQVIKQLTARLANKAYVSQAPAAVVGQTKIQLAGAREQLDLTKQEYKRFSSL